MLRFLNCMNVITTFFALIALSGCSNLAGGPPSIRMKYLDPYPTFVGGGIHTGVDLDVPLGSPVRAMGDGLVRSAFVMDLRGIRTPVVVIAYEDGRLISHYIHIDDISVQQGERVTKGQIVAKTALTGPAGPNSTKPVPYPHLHLEIYSDSERIDPLKINMTCPSQGGRWWYPVGCYEN
jgi:murein DD-endopeptidase MepM/ murein hydrolase activator NlpD